LELVNRFEQILFAASQAVRNASATASSYFISCRRTAGVVGALFKIAIACLRESPVAASRPVSRLCFSSRFAFLLLRAKLCEMTIGKRLYAMWHYRDNDLIERAVRVATRGLKRLERDELRRCSGIMPAWLHNQCVDKYAWIN
jgi:hypothetical protein